MVEMQDISTISICFNQFHCYAIAQKLPGFPYYKEYLLCNHYIFHTVAKSFCNIVINTAQAQGGGYMLLTLAMGKQNPIVVNKVKGYVAIKRLSCDHTINTYCFMIDVLLKMRLCHISYYMYVRTFEILSTSNTWVNYSTFRISHYIPHTYNVGMYVYTHQ